MLRCSLNAATTKDMMTWMHDLCTGLGHMFTHAVVHRDIKPANCLLVYGCGGFILKLCDFGQGAFLVMEGTNPDSEQFSSPMLTSLLEHPTTFRYAAPEVIEKANYSFPCDIWACGVILWEVMQDTTCGVWVCRCTPNIRYPISVSREGLREVQQHTISSVGIEHHPGGVGRRGVMWGWVGDAGRRFVMHVRPTITRYIT